MVKYIIVGCDLHERSMVLRIGHDRKPSRTRTYGNNSDARCKMIRDLQQEAEEVGAQVEFAYEASALGYGLHDQLTEAGIGSHVLAPTKLPQSHHRRVRKCDERDAERALEVLRGHLLAGNALPEVWIPGQQTRDDREVVRARMDVGEKATSLRIQIKMLLKRYRLDPPGGMAQEWTRKFEAWLKEQTAAESPLASGARAALSSLLRQLAAQEEELAQLDRAISELAQQERYRTYVVELLTLKGVGVLTAMVFLTEMGDLRRFANRRQIGAYLGLVPSAFETGESNDRKGHITKQGSPRVRKILCQAAWSRLRIDEKEQDFYSRVTARNPKHKKIAAVGVMRRLAICMWHRALTVAPEPGANGITPPLPSPPQRAQGGEAPACTEDGSAKQHAGPPKIGKPAHLR